MIVAYFIPATYYRPAPNSNHTIWMGHVCLAPCAYVDRLKWGPPKIDNVNVSFGASHDFLFVARVWAFRRVGRTMSFVWREIHEFWMFSVSLFSGEVAERRLRSTKNGIAWIYWNVELNGDNPHNKPKRRFSIQAICAECVRVNNVRLCVAADPVEFAHTHRILCRLETHTGRFGDTYVFIIKWMSRFEDEAKKTVDCARWTVEPLIPEFQHTNIQSLYCPDYAKLSKQTLTHLFADHRRNAIVLLLFACYCLLVPIAIDLLFILASFAAYLRRSVVFPARIPGETRKNHTQKSHNNNNNHKNKQ